MKEPKSSTSPILNEENLKILVNNDASEIATKFYPDKFKDRWKKAK
jgi:glutathionyl-hydroquinone reductase